MISAGCRLRRQRKHVSSSSVAPASVESQKQSSCCDWARSLSKQIHGVIMTTVERCTQSLVLKPLNTSSCSGLLLASVSSSTEDQKAVLPSKDRTLDGRLLMDSINASETAKESTDDERIVISEVCALVMAVFLISDDDFTYLYMVCRLKLLGLMMGS